MHSALTPSPLAACREGRSVCVCVRARGGRVRKGGGDEEEAEEEEGWEGGVFCPQPVSLCVWRLFKKGSFVFKKSSCLPHYLLSAM